MNIRRLCVALVLLLSARPAFPWGANGHRAVGRIAEHHLSEAAARGVASILGTESLAQAATWPDEIRADPSRDRAKPWHYVDLDDGEAYDPSKYPEGNVVEAIDRFAKVVRDPKADRTARIEALRFLVHFVGDLHQPLHVGRRGDHGGNTTQVTWFGEATNLHWVWDERILEAEKLSFSELVEFIDHPTPDEIKTWQSAGVLDWVKESADLRARAYEIGDGKLGYPYQYRNIPLVKRRILQAGIRLAGRLNAIFAESGPSLPDRPPIPPMPPTPPVPPTPNPPHSP